MKIRINKFIADSGICSRRKADELISKGLVEINGQTATLGQAVDTNQDSVKFQGRELNIMSESVYYAFNKPAHVVSTVSDDRGRRTLMNFFPPELRIYPVGRLDYDSTGLIILTNDGNFTNKMTHPRYHVPKIYEVAVDKNVTDAMLSQLRGGIQITDDKGIKVTTQPAEVRVLKRYAKGTVLEFTLTQGIKRQIRLMCRSVGLEVVSLERVQIGNIKLGNLRSGEHRMLNEKEIKELTDSFAEEQ